MCKKVSTFDEIEELFKDYFSNDCFVESRSSYELDLEVPFFPSKFSHVFSSNVHFYIGGRFYSPETFRVIIKFFV